MIWEVPSTIEEIERNKVTHMKLQILHQKGDNPLLGIKETFYIVITVIIMGIRLKIEERMEECEKEQSKKENQDLEYEYVQWRIPVGVFKEGY